MTAPLGFTRFRDITLTGSSAGATPASYSRVFTLHKGVGVDTATDIYLAGEADNFPHDIRFTDENDVELGYWLRPDITANEAAFTIKVGVIGASPATKTLRVYVKGGASTQTTSNGTDTFSFIADPLNSSVAADWGVDAGELQYAKWVNFDADDVNSPFFTANGYACDVFKDGSTWYLFYRDGTDAISYQTSSDGKTWSGATQIVSAGAATWHDTRLHSPHVWKEANTYYLIASGRGSTQARNAIGLWTASSITGPWTPDASNPVLVGSSENREASRPIKDGSTYYCYVNNIGSGFRREVDLYTYTDPAGTWTKDTDNIFAGGYHTSICFKRAGTFYLLISRYLAGANRSVFELWKKTGTQSPKLDSGNRECIAVVNAGSDTATDWDGEDIDAPAIPMDSVDGDIDNNPVSATQCRIYYGGGNSANSNRQLGVTVDIDIDDLVAPGVSLVSEELSYMMPGHSTNEGVQGLARTLVDTPADAVVEAEYWACDTNTLGRHGIGLRSSASDAFYAAILQDASQENLELREARAGDTWRNIGSPIGVTIGRAVWRKLLLSVEGTNQRALFEGVTERTGSDPTLTAAGKAVLRWWDNDRRGANRWRWFRVRPFIHPEPVMTGWGGFQDVGGVNAPPVVISLPVTTATEGQPYSYDVEASDPDIGDTLTYWLDVSPSGMTIDPTTGLIQWTPDDSQVGDNDVTVRVEDTAGLFDTQSFLVAVLPEGQVDWFDDDWNYRRPVVIPNPAGEELTDYPVQVRLDSSFDFSEALPDGIDLRATAGDGATRIPFWIEVWDSTSATASIWVKVPSVPIQGTAIYLYYGNASATLPDYVITDVYDIQRAGGYEGSNPVIPCGADVNDPDYKIREISNIFYDPDDDDERYYKILYTAYTGPQRNTYIAYAYSSDGKHWTKHNGGNRVINRRLEDPCIVKYNGVYYAYFEDKEGGGHKKIRAYNSTDFINWADLGAVLDEGPAGTWDSEAVASPHVVGANHSTPHNGAWYMLYEGWDASRTEFALGLAYSTDLINWTKEENPVKSEDWAGAKFVCPEDFWRDEATGMWYALYQSDFSRPPDNAMIYSADLINWTEYSGNPIDDESSKSRVGMRATYNGSDWLVYWSGGYGAEKDRIGINLGYPQKAIFGDEAVFHVYDGFEDEDVGDEPLNWSTSGEVRVVDSPVRQGQRSIRQSDTSSRRNTQLIRDFAQLDKGVVEAWMRRTSTSSDSYGDYDIYLYGGSTLSCVAGLGRDGDFHYSDGSYQNTGVFWETDTWYLVTIVFDAAAQLYDFVVYDEFLTELVREEGISFSRESSFIDSAKLYTSLGYEGDGYADDFRVREFCGAEIEAVVGTEEVR